MQMELLEKLRQSVIGAIKPAPVVSLPVSGVSGAAGPRPMPTCTQPNAAASVVASKNSREDTESCENVRTGICVGEYDVPYIP